MRTAARLAVHALLVVSWLGMADPLYDTFGNGKAEVSSYRVVQPRYGEPRKAYAVLVFVPEDLNRRTRIKVENDAATPEKERLAVLKLNRVLHFDTGVYNYAAMTSTFCALSSEAGFPLLFPLKISISVSEWCGNFYEHLLPEAGGARRVMHSYFEAEGDRSDFIKAPAEGIYEDSLPILLRELKGPWLRVGEKKKVPLLPSLWESRLTHESLAWHDGVIEHPKPEQWTWQIGVRRVSYQVTPEYPHYIVKWESSTGEKGERIKTMHLAYWQHHDNLDLPLRKQLGIP